MMLWTASVPKICSKLSKLHSQSACSTRRPVILLQEKAWEEGSGHIAAYVIVVLPKKVDHRSRPGLMIDATKCLAFSKFFSHPKAMLLDAATAENPMLYPLHPQVRRIFTQQKHILYTQLFRYWMGMISHGKSGERLKEIMVQGGVTGHQFYIMASWNSKQPVFLWLFQLDDEPNHYIKKMGGLPNIH